MPQEIFAKVEPTNKLPINPGPHVAAKTSISDKLYL